MIEIGKIDELAAKLSGLLPPGAHQFRGEMEQQFKSVLSNALAKMDLVSRDDFDLQKSALERAQVQLQALEQRLEALETPPPE